MHENRDRDLLEWLVAMGADDRERYREIRALLWDMFARNQRGRRAHSDKPSKYS